MVYQDGWKKLAQDGQQELIWFTSKVMPAVQKHWKPFWMRGSGNIAKNYDIVTALNEALGCFCSNIMQISSHSLVEETSSHNKDK